MILWQIAKKFRLNLWMVESGATVTCLGYLVNANKLIDRITDMDAVTPTKDLFHHCRAQCDGQWRYAEFTFGSYSLRTLSWAASQANPKQIVVRKRICSIMARSGEIHAFYIQCSLSKLNDLDHLCIDRIPSCIGQCSCYNGRLGFSVYFWCQGCLSSLLKLCAPYISITTW